MHFNCTAILIIGHFKVDITDASDTIIVTISETLAKKMLSLTAEQIYETVTFEVHTYIPLTTRKTYVL